MKLFKSWRHTAIAVTAAIFAVWTLAATGQGAASAHEPTGLEAVAAIEQVLADTIARCEKSVVSIARVSERDPLAADTQPDFFAGRKPSPRDSDFQPTAFATGVVIGPGLVLTNHHVLAAGKSTDTYYVTSVGRKVFQARIKSSDPRSDMAVLEVTDKFESTDFPLMPLGDGSKLRKGQIVVALGNPYAIARDGEASASWGIVANLQRKAPPSTDERQRSTLHHYGTLIQTDAKLSLGTSGGALVNLKGEMVGLTTSIAAVAGFEEAAGYAIPVDAVFRRVLGELKEGREPAFGLIGIMFDLDRPGNQVKSTLPGGPANKAGILPNDIVLAVDDQPVETRDQLMLRVGSLAPGAIAHIELERAGRRIQKEVSLGKFPVQRGAVVTNPTPRWRGLMVDYSTALEEFEDRVLAGNLPLEACVIVRNVSEASPAWSAGLRRGMLITQVGSQRVEVPDEFNKAIAGKAGDVALKISDGAGKTSVITVPAVPAVPASAAPARPQL